MSDDWSVDDDIAEESNEPEIDESLAAEAPEFVNLPDGRTLVVGGARAGEIIEQPTDQAATVAAVRSRDEALAGNVPLFLCMRGLRFFEREPQVLAELHAGHGAVLALGVVGRIARTSAAANLDRLNIPVAQVRIADPEGYLAFDDRLVLEPGVPKTRHLERAPYLANLRNPDPNSYALSLLDHQRDAGANLLLTSGRAVSAADVAGSFQEISAEADALQALLEPGERLALNLTLPSEFMTMDTVFNEVLNELSELDQFDLLYLRVQRFAPSEASAPLAEVGPLGRLFDLGVWAERQGVGLIHAQSGLLGWFLLASGAFGFSTGGTSSDQMFKRFAGGGGSGNPPLERHFERALLHPVSAATHAALTNGGPPYVDYATRWGTAALTSTPYSHRLSAPHSLYSLGWLTADMARAATPRTGWRPGVRTAVHSARASALALGLAGRENPAHLGSWVNFV